MPNYSNLEQTIEEILFNYGGVLQKLAEIQKEVYEQIEALKNAGVKIRRANKTYSPGTVLTCIGSGNGSKFLFTQKGGTTGEDFKDESWYNSLVVGQTYIDGGVTWEVLEDAYTKHSIVESAMEASHASTADFATSAASAGYALSAAYIGPFQVKNLGTATSSGSLTPGGEVVTSTGINYEVIDPTRTSLPPNAGVIVNGEKNIPVPYSSGFLPNGETLYLWGSSNGENSGFVMGWHINREIQKNEFLTALAHNSGGKVQQIQFGDIVTPWPGEDQEIYGGPFKVEANGEITQDNTVPIRIIDPTSPINQTTGKHEWAGKIFAGENYYTVNIVSGNLNNGDYIYLMGDSKNNSVEFHYVAYEPQVTSDGEPSGGQRTITSAGFYVRLAKNEGGKIIQIQHGDITVPPWKVTYADSAEVAISATTASIADYASSAGYYGPFHVSSTGENTVKIFDDTFPGQNQGGTVVIGSTNYYPGSASVNLYNGHRLYLVGTSASGNVTFQYSQYQDGTSISPASNQFYAPLAVKINNKILQTQFGNIVQPILGGTNAITYEYEGPFKVSITGTTAGTNNVTVQVIDPNDNTTPQRAGRVFNGSSINYVISSSIQVTDGGYVYLNGTSGYAPSIQNTAGNNNTSQYSIRLAKNEGGKIIQMQFGDVYSIPWNSLSAGSAISASTASYASYADYIQYRGPFMVSATSVNPYTSAASVVVIDPTDLRTAGSEIAGKVFDGENVMEVGSSGFYYIANNAYVYLNGTTGSNPYISDTAGNNNSSQFSIKIAKNVNGVIKQIQFGDVYSIPWNALNAQVAISASTASVAEYAQKAGYVEYNGPFHVSGTYDDVQEAFTGVSVKDNTRTGNVGGYMVLGSVMSSVQSATGITLADGYKLYLKASKTANGYNFSYISGNTQPTPGTNEFITQLAYNSGGKLIQTQFGDIIQPSTGVTKINVTGGTITPASGTGEVTIDIPAGGGGDFPDWGNIYESACAFETSNIAPKNGWIYIDSEIYNNGNPGTATIKLIIDGNQFMVNKLTTNGDTDVGINHGFSISVKQGSTFSVHVDNPYNFIIGLPGSTNGNYYFYSNEPLS